MAQGVELPPILIFGNSKYTEFSPHLQLRQFQWRHSERPIVHLCSFVIPALIEKRAQLEPNKDKLGLQA